MGILLGVKTCIKCKETKSVIEFTKSSNNKDGLKSKCKMCRSNYGKDYYNRNRKSLCEKARLNGKRPERKAYMRKYHFDRSGRLREQSATRPRPINCEVCNAPAGKKRLNYDHDHKTGLFRGWLCLGCNTALGYVKDNPITLRGLAVYLEEYARCQLGRQRPKRKRVLLLEPK